MKMKQRATLILILLTNVFFFQNCNGPVPVFNSQSSDEKSDSASPNGDSNGQPYDGKIYVLLGALCSDQTSVQSKILMKSSTAGVLVRRNCQNILPVDLSAKDFQLVASNPNQIIYESQTYTLEILPVVVPNLVSWNYQLSGTLKPMTAQIFDIDVFDYDAATIQSLKTAGHTVICYIPAGAYETTRPDSGLFNPADIGNRLFTGSPDRWLDTRSASVRSLIIARLDLAKSKGCQGVDFDSVDAYTSNSGFPLTAATQIDFNQFLAFAAHDRGMTVALNNVPGLAGNLVHAFDFVIAEQCFESGECSSYQSFSAKGKAVLAAEYTPLSPADCSTAKASGISLTYFSSNLDGTRRETCP
jgi:hypothetical protein